MSTFFSRSPSSRRRLILAPQTRLVPASSLPAERRAELCAEEGDVWAGVPGSAEASLLISAELALLVELFRRPATLFEAAARLAARRGVNAFSIVEAGRAPLQQLIERGILRDAGGFRPESPPLFEVGQRPVQGMRIVQPVHRLAGSEIYLVHLDDGRPAAFKIEPRRAGKGRLEREIAALEHLGGGPAPELYTSGQVDSKPWMLREWIDGIDPLRAGRSARSEDQALAAGGVRMAELMRRVARAFAAVHGHGVLHGDVHPGNVLIDEAGRARLIDFALADGPWRADERATESQNESTFRAGSFLSIEPEQARALLDGRGAIPVTPRGEQFAVAALLYETACGVPYQDFRLDRSGLLEQIAEAQALPFAHHRLDPWPALEAILRRALDADPQRRFTDVDELAGALERLPPLRRRRRPRPRLPVVARRQRRRLRLLTPIDDDLGPSIYEGAAGVAYSLLRLSGQLQRPSSLAAAESWLDEAKSRPLDAAKKERVGAVSPFHTQAGTALLDALMGHALGDAPRRAKAVAHFIECSKPTAESELLLGRSGSLLAASLLRDLALDSVSRRALNAAAGRWCDEILSEQSTREAISSSTYWGMAHGWAGELYALLRWLAPRDGQLPTSLERRLLELAKLARPRGRGRVWPQPGGGPLSGWCHGSAGYVFLWHAAGQARLRNTQQFRELAAGAAWDAFEGPGEDGSLCCGLAGRAWSLLHHGRASGEEIWRHRAAALAERAASASFPGHNNSLFKGQLALVLLDAELHGVEPLGFPFVGDEKQRPGKQRGNHVLEDWQLLDVAGGHQRQRARRRDREGE